jgi:hypothetical protein
MGEAPHGTTNAQAPITKETTMTKRQKRQQLCASSATCARRSRELVIAICRLIGH